MIPKVTLRQTFLNQFTISLFQLLSKKSMDQGKIGTYTLYCLPLII